MAYDGITLRIGDITKQGDVGAIVNAANSRLAGGGGVDGAIHLAGGPEIMAECARIGFCPVGSAVITGGGKLGCPVIHAVGPIWYGGKSGEDELLASAYRSAMRIAAENGIEKVAFPSISTGAYGFPVERAAKIALSTVGKCLDEYPAVREVVFVLFSKSDYETYAQALSALSGAKKQ